MTETGAAMGIGQIATVIGIAWGLWWLATRYGRPVKHARRQHQVEPAAPAPLPAQAAPRQRAPRLSATAYIEMLGEGIMACQAGVVAAGKAFRRGIASNSQPVTMSTPLLTAAPDLGYQPLDVRPQNEERRTKNEAAPAQNDDMPVTKNRLAAILKLAAGGVDQETILGVYRKEPAAIVSALKVVRGYQVAHLMGGAYADNLKEIERVLAVRAAEVAE